MAGRLGAVAKLAASALNALVEKWQRWPTYAMKARCSSKPDTFARANVNANASTFTCVEGSE